LIKILLFLVLLLFFMPIDERSISHFGPSDHDARFDYKCGHCDRNVTGRVVCIYNFRSSSDSILANSIRFLICPSCSMGSVWHRIEEKEDIIPGTKPGDKLEGLPNEIEKAYNEARKCFSIKAYTGCELLCRKILMYIGANKGAPEGQSFVSYLNFLEQEGYITPTIKTWADRIRQFGNMSTHELTPPDKSRTEATFRFTMVLLRIIYEMEHLSDQF